MTEVLTGGIDFDTPARVVPVDPGFGLVVGPDAPPEPPEPLLDAPVLTTTPQSMSLPTPIAWTAVPSAIGYHYLIYAGSSTERLLDEGLLEAVTEFTVADLPVGRYSLGLRAIAPSGLEGKESRLTFDVLPSRPLVASVSQPYGSRTTLSWNPVPGATAYHAQLATDQGFAQTLTDAQTSDVELPIELRLLPGRYYLRVASLMDALAGEFSEVGTLDVETAPVVVQIGRRSRRQAAVFWSPLAGVSSYLLEVSRYRDFRRNSNRLVNGDRAEVGVGRGARWVRVTPQLVGPGGTVAPGLVSEPLVVFSRRCRKARGAITSC